jgi:hypothetical protein
VLVRAEIPDWGTVHEIVARLDLVGSGFERTLVGFLLHLPRTNQTGTSTHRGRGYEWHPDRFYLVPALYAVRYLA